MMKTTHDHSVRLVEAPSIEDHRERGQLHCSDGKEVKGGLKHAMC
jgi:hypothetical protein